MYPQQREAITSPGGSQSTSIQPSQRKTKQQRFGGTKGTVTPTMPSPQDTLMEHRRRLKESQSQANFNSSADGATLSTSMQRQERQPRVPRLNLNLNSSLQQTQTNTYKKLKSSGRSNKKHHLSMEQVTSSHGGQNEVEYFSPNRSGGLNHSRSPATSQIYQPRFAQSHKAPGGNSSVGQLYKKSNSQVQFTPVRQFKGQQPLQSKQQNNGGALQQSQNASSQMLQQNSSCEVVRLSNLQKGPDEEHSDHQDSYRLPQFAANKHMTAASGDYEIQNRILVAAPWNQTKDDQPKIRERAAQDDVGGHDEIMEFSHDEDHHSRNQRDEIMDNSVMSIEINEGQSEMTQSLSQSQPGAIKQRVPREDRKKRRIQAAQEESLSSKNDGSQPVVTASAQLKNLLDQTSRQASQQIQNIEQLKMKRSCSRSSRKTRGGDHQPQYQMMLTESSDSKYGVRSKVSSSAVFAKRKDSRQLYQTSTASQYPKFEVDLSSFNQDQQVIQTQSNEKTSTAKRIADNDREVNGVRVNKFGEEGIEENRGVNGTPGMYSSQAMGKRRFSESRSNVSLSITRRNKESNVVGGGASETLNQLVQNSVQNLSKILQRPSTNQDFLSEGVRASRDISVETPVKPFNSIALIRPAPQELHSIAQEQTEDYGQEQPPSQQTLQGSGSAMKTKPLKARSYTASMIQARNNVRTTPSQYERPSPITDNQKLQTPAFKPQKPQTLFENLKKAAPQAVNPLSQSMVLPKSGDGLHDISKQAAMVNISKGTNPMKDLSIIDESEKITGGQQPQQQNSDTKKTYMQMTATAAARKEAIQGSSQQYQQRRMREQATRIAEPTQTNPSSKVMKSSGPQQSALSASRSSVRRDSATGVAIVSAQLGYGGFATQSLKGSEQAVRKIQRALKLYVSWRRLHRMANFRQRFLAVIQGYRIRRFLKKAPTPALVKEIRLMIRRENRQPANYLKEQQRKKTRVSINQLIIACRSAIDSTLTAQQSITVVSSRRVTPLRQVPPGSNMTSGVPAQSNTSTLFKKRDRYQQAKFPQPQEHQQQPLEADDRSATLQKLRAQTVRQESINREKTSLSVNNKQEASRNASRPTEQNSSSTLRKSTKSFQMKIGGEAAHPSTPKGSSSGQQQSQTVFVVSSHRTGKSMTESLSSVNIHQSKQSIMNKGLHRQSSAHRKIGFSNNPKEIPQAPAQRSKSKVYQPESLLSPKIAKEKGNSDRTLTKQSSKISQKKTVQLAPKPVISPLKKQNSKTSQATNNCSKPPYTRAIDVKPTATNVKSITADINTLGDSKRQLNLQKGSDSTLSSLYLHGREAAGPLAQTPKARPGVLREKSRSRLARSPPRNTQDSLLKKIIDENSKVAQSAQKTTKSTTLQLTKQHSSGQKPSQQYSNSKHQSGSTLKVVGKVPLVSASLDSSAQSSIRTEKGSHHTIVDSLTTPVRQTRQARKQRSSQGQDGETLNLLDLEIMDPQEQQRLKDKTTPQTMPTSAKLPSQQLITAKSTTTDKQIQSFPIVDGIRDLLTEMNQKAQKLHDSNQKVGRTKQTTQSQKKKQDELLDFQAQKRLQMERLIIDLRRDFEMACLEQRSSAKEL